MLNLTPKNKPLDMMKGVEQEYYDEATPAAIAARAGSLSLDMGTTDTETKRQNAFGETTAIQEAKGAVIGKLSPQQVAEKAVSEGKSIDEIIQEYNDTYAKVEQVAKSKDYYKIMGSTVDDPEINAAGANLATNLSIAHDTFTAEIARKGEGMGWYSYVGNALDRELVRYLLAGGIFEQMTGRSERMGMAILEAATTMPQEEFIPFIKNFAEDLKGEGFFTDDNIFALYAGLDAATNAGYDPEAKMLAMLATFDALTIVVPLAKPLTVGAIEASKVASVAAKAKLSRLIKADSAVAVEIVTSGADTAAEKVAKAVIAGDAPESVSEALVPEILNLNKVDGEQIYVPGLNTGKSAQIIDETVTINLIGEVLASGAAGRVASAEVIAERLATIVATFKKTYANPVMNFNYSKDVLDNVIAHVWVGNKKGNAWGYNQKRHAVAAAEGIEGASVVRVTKDGKLGYAIQISERIDLAKGEVFSLKTAFNKVSELVTRYVGSAPLRDIERLDILYQQGEGVRSAFKEIAKPLLKKLQALSRSDKAIVSKILRDLRDSPVKSFLREWHTDAEFVKAYKAERLDGAAPSEKTMEAWRAIVDLSDSAFIMKANEVLSKYVSKGYNKVRLNSGVTMPAKKIGKIPDGEKYVWDVKHQYMAKVGKETESAKTVWKLDKPFVDAKGSSATHAIDPSEVGILEFHDVLGYNAGGHRTNPNARYFLVLLNKAGNAMRPKAMMTAFSEKEILKAEAEFKALALAKKEGRLTDEFVLAHNDFDPDIKTAAQFEALIKKNDWDLERTISHKARDAKAATDDADHPMFGSSMEDYIKTDMKRLDDVLPEYGGGHNYNIDPLNSIFQNYGQVANPLATRAWAVNTMSSWAKTAWKHQDLVKIPVGTHPDDYHAIWHDAVIVGKSPAAMRLKEIRNIAQRRLGTKDQLAEAFEDFGNMAIEHIFDASSAMWKTLGVNKKGFRLTSLNPTNKLLTLGFQSAFGFLNPSQFFLQGYQVASIVAVSPRKGIQGVGLTWGMRLVLNAGDGPTTKLAIKRFAEGSGLTEEAVTELATYIKTSGRSIVDGDMMELGTPIGYGVKSYTGEMVKKMGDAGLYFFRQGERLSRLTAINTAFLEFKELHPTLSALSDFGRQFITKREGALTQHMTTGSKAAIQSGPAGLLKMPLQWLGYSLRIAESVIFGTGGLTFWERARLWTVAMPIFGATGFGAAGAASYASEFLGIEPGSSLHTFVRYGVLDTLFEGITGVDSAFATRLAPIDQYVNLYNKVFGEDKSFKEVTLGPSGSIVGALTTALWNVAGDAFHLRPVNLSASVKSVLMQPSGLSGFIKAAGIMNNGLYQSKTGTYPMGDAKFSTGDAIMVALGWTPKEVQEMQITKTIVYTDGKEFKKFNKYVQDRSQIAMVMMKDGDRDQMIRGLEMLKELNTMVKLSAFSHTQMRQITTGMWRIDENEFMKVYQALERADRQYDLANLVEMRKDME